MTRFRMPIVAVFMLFAIGVANAESNPDSRWSEAKAAHWYSSQPWLVGSNFVPSTAINELEMWQPDTFDATTIDRELGWAESIGMNTMRVFLHNLLWQSDSKGFLDRMEKFLQIADKHKIRITFVLLDSVWDPHPKLGKQHEPTPHVHNSGWVQAPGADMLKDPARWEPELKPYVQGVLKHFAHDRRIVMWDLMNEPDNESGQYAKVELPNKAEVALQLLKREWQWAREVNPDQPLTSGVWRGDWTSDATVSEMARFQLNNSDVITFHSYDAPTVTKAKISTLRRYRRPIICTEYMARPQGSTFQSILPLLQEEKVGAYNWGFVSGRSQTIYPWDSWEKQYKAEPTPWFHDVFHTDGKPYDPAEVSLIKKLTAEANGKK